MISRIGPVGANEASSREELEVPAREVIAQPRGVVERLKALLGEQ